LLRKGGILETASGFVVESKKFLLFPTFEHQSYANLKPQFHKYLDYVKQNMPTNGQNKITSYAEVIAEADLRSDQKINQLSEFHVWSDSYIKARINWMPDKATKAIFLKTYKVPGFEIPLKDEYHGCKSWIDINAKLDSGKPVMDETELSSKLERFMEITS
jgi:hypothetical protein